MKNTKTGHTPGEWKNKNGNISGQWENGKEVGIAIVGVTSFCGKDSGGPNDKRMKAENKANAALIAAAPGLLAALEDVVFDLAESHASELADDHNGEGPKGCSYCDSIKAARAAIAKATGGK